MKILHVANTQFEWELTQTHVIPLEQAIKRNPIALQLQFLPLLYAPQKDHIAVTSLPSDFNSPRLQLLSSPSHYDRVESWGASRAVADWARIHNIPYPTPPWNVVQQVNSKAFSFSHAPKLPGATLLETESQAQAWLKPPFPKVLKTCFGLSGKGHLIIDATTPHETISKFLHKEWNQKRSVLAEPWVKRILDFSTQWLISDTIQELGVTICENDAFGKYIRNRVGMAFPYPHFLEEHRNIALPILRRMAALGYVGNVGIDAFIYEGDEGATLHPIVEINARKTMGYVALKLQQNQFPHEVISLSYVSSHQPGLLPLQLQDGTTFSRQLILDKQ
jgi:hypothetical protein